MEKQFIIDENCLNKGEDICPDFYVNYMNSNQ